jgi:hypothetical protein
MKSRIVSMGGLEEGTRTTMEVDSIATQNGNRKHSSCS